MVAAKHRAQDAPSGAKQAARDYVERFLRHRNQMENGGFSRERDKASFKRSRRDCESSVNQ